MTSHERVDWQLEAPTLQSPWVFAANLLARAILASSRVFRDSHEKSKQIVAKSLRKGFAQRIELLARRNLENGPENRPKSSKIASKIAPRGRSGALHGRLLSVEAARSSGFSIWSVELVRLADRAGRPGGHGWPFDRARSQARTSSLRPAMVISILIIIIIIPPPLRGSGTALTLRGMPPTLESKFERRSAQRL